MNRLLAAALFLLLGVTATATVLLLGPSDSATDATASDTFGDPPTSVLVGSDGIPIELVGNNKERPAKKPSPSDTRPSLTTRSTVESAEPSVSVSSTVPVGSSVSSSTVAVDSVTSSTAGTSVTTAPPTTVTSTTRAPSTTVAPTTTAPSTTTTRPVTTTTTPPTTTTAPTTTTTTTTVPVTPTTVWTGSGLWKPKPGTTWHWQLSGTIDVTVEAEMFDVDLFETSTSTINNLHQRGRAVVCYMSAGSWEDYRPDADQFPDEVKGRSNGWPGEKWLDIRQLDVLRPIMEARLDLCAKKGFDGVEFDLISGFTNNTGFPLTAADQTTYNLFLANAAHARGLSAGFKNNVEQAAAQQRHFDFAVNEECYAYNECSMLTPFINANKAVFHVEYDIRTSKFCPATTSLGFSSMKKRLNLGTWQQTCW